MTLRIESIDNDAADIERRDHPAGVTVNITADSTEHDGNVYLTVNVTHEGIIADTFDADGNCTGTIGDDFDGWHRRIEDDPAQRSDGDVTVWRLTREDLTIKATEWGYATPISDEQFERIANCLDNSTVNECIDDTFGQVLDSVPDVMVTAYLTNEED